MKRNIFKCLGMALICSSVALKADNSADLFAGLSRLLLDAKITPESKKAIYSVIAPQLSKDDLGKTKLTAKGIFFGKGAEAQQKFNEYLDALIPDSPAAYAQKFADTLDNNAESIILNFKEGTKIGANGASSADVAKVKKAVDDLYKVSTTGKKQPK